MSEVNLTGTAEIPMRYHVVANTSAWIGNGVAGVEAWRQGCSKSRAALVVGIVAGALLSYMCYVHGTRPQLRAIALLEYQANKVQLPLPSKGYFVQWSAGQVFRLALYPVFTYGTWHWLRCETGTTELSDHLKTGIGCVISLIVGTQIGALAVNQAAVVVWGR